jgi:hypothetical protein
MPNLHICKLTDVLSEDEQSVLRMAIAVALPEIEKGKQCMIEDKSLDMQAVLETATEIDGQVAMLRGIEGRLYTNG